MVLYLPHTLCDGRPQWKDVSTISATDPSAVRPPQVRRRRRGWCWWCWRSWWAWGDGGLACRRCDAVTAAWHQPSEPRPDSVASNYLPWVDKNSQGSMEQGRADNRVMESGVCVSKRFWKRMQVEWLPWVHCLESRSNSAPDHIYLCLGVRDSVYYFCPQSRMEFLVLDN